MVGSCSEGLDSDVEEENKEDFIVTGLSKEFAP